MFTRNISEMLKTWNQMLTLSRVLWTISTLSGNIRLDFHIQSFSSVPLIIRVNSVWLIIHSSCFSDLLFVSENFHYKNTRNVVFHLLSDMIYQKLCVKGTDPCYSLFFRKHDVILPAYLICLPNLDILNLIGQLVFRELAQEELLPRGSSVILETFLAIWTVNILSW